VKTKTTSALNMSPIAGAVFSGEYGRPVSGHSREEVARKAGVDGGGDVFSSGDVRRARWIQSLQRAGVPLDEMATAVGRELSRSPFST
jgi:hypothetical protein